MEHFQHGVGKKSALILAGGLWAGSSSAALAAPVRFGVIGDYGLAPVYFAHSGEAQVAAMVNGWNPNFIVSIGDNNYGDDGQDNNYMDPTVIQNNIGAYYRNGSAFASGYNGPYITSNAVTNRFFPVLGNSDYGEETSSTSTPASAAWYSSYFSGLPTNPSGNNRYYTFSQGTTASNHPLVQFFMFDDDTAGGELDFNGTDPANSVEGQWLKNALAGSSALYKVVVTHHAPYTSGDAGGTADTELPFKAWGATAVLSGHAHIYERLAEPDPGMTNSAANDLPYIVNGLGGDHIQGFNQVGGHNAFIAGSQAHYEDNYGAMQVQANDSNLTFNFFSVDNTVTPLDTLVIAAPTPEPASAGVLLLGATALYSGARRRNRGGNR